MALFGAPVAHEDHAQRACHAALSIQKAIERYGEKIKEQHGAEFKMRIGLNSGPVIVGSIGDDLRMDYTAVGDTTNLAHRMQDMAEPGSVLSRAIRIAWRGTSSSSLSRQGRGQGQRGAAGGIRAPSANRGRDSDRGRSGQGTDEVRGTQEGDRDPQGGVRAAQIRLWPGHRGRGRGRSREVEAPPRTARNASEGEYSYLEGRCLHYGGVDALFAHSRCPEGIFRYRGGGPRATIKKKVRERIRQLDEKRRGRSCRPSRGPVPQGRR